MSVCVLRGISPPVLPPSPPLPASGSTSVTLVSACRHMLHDGCSQFYVLMYTLFIYSFEVQIGSDLGISAGRSRAHRYRNRYALSHVIII